MHATQTFFRKPRQRPSFLGVKAGETRARVAVSADKPSALSVHLARRLLKTKRPGVCRGVILYENECTTYVYIVKQNLQIPQSFLPGRSQMRLRLLSQRQYSHYAFYR